MKYADAAQAVLMDGSSRDAGGYDDFVSLSGVVGFVLQSPDWTGREDPFAEVLHLVRELLTRGWVTVGDLSRSGFVPWKLDTQGSLDRIEREWRALGRDIYPGDICWLANTPAGNARVAEARR